MKKNPCSDEAVWQNRAAGALEMLKRVLDHEAGSLGFAKDDGSGPVVEVTRKHWQASRALWKRARAYQRQLERESTWLDWEKKP